MSKIYAHISGYPGSGKTTLSIELNERYDDIAVKDTDDFMEGIDPSLPFEKINKIMKYKLDTFIKKNANKKVVLVGFFTLLDKTEYKFFLNTSLEISSKRVVARLLNDSERRHKFIINAYREADKSDKNFCNFVKNYLNYKHIMLENKYLKNSYLRQGYKIIGIQQILNFLDEKLTKRNRTK